MIEQSETPGAIWDVLSPAAREVCFFLGDSAETQALVRGVFDKWKDVDIDEALGELQAAGILETVTYAQRMTEMVEDLKPKWDLTDWKQLKGRLLTESERLYLRTRENLAAYQRAPGAFKTWEDPEWRLTEPFRKLVVQKREEERKALDAKSRQQHSSLPSPVRSLLSRRGVGG